jgi:hypothetical protein
LTTPTLTDDEVAWAADYEERTGNKLDSKRLLEIRKARDPDVGWSVKSFPGLKNIGGAKK